MTVCIAAICSWNYGPKEKQIPGAAVLAITDRMITVGDTEYEPSQQKVGRLTSSSWVLIAGDYSIHSQAILDARKQVGTNAADTRNVATIYGGCLQKIRLKAAEDEILAPLGLNMDTFIAQQREMSPSLVDSLATQLQHYSGEGVEALVVGMDSNSANLYYVDHRGTVHCFNDVGFAAIGLGAWHARSQLMQARYVNTVPFIRALAIAYGAKKTAEVAPGVGEETDIQIIFPSGIEPLFPRVKDKLGEVYEQYIRDRQPLVEHAIEQLGACISNPETYKVAPSTEQSVRAGKSPGDAGGPEAPKTSSPTEPEPPPEQPVPPSQN